MNHHTKTMIYFTIITFSIVSLGFSQWEVQESGVANSLNDVCFVDSLYGWAVGDSGTIIATTDGGNTWTRQVNPVDTLRFLKVEFVNRLVGFAGGNGIIRDPYAWIYNPVFLKTIDGGDNWIEIDLGLDPEYLFEDMEFIDSNTGWVLSLNIGRTYFEDRDGILLKTENGGNDWSVLRQTKPYVITSIAFWDNNYGYLLYGPGYDSYDDSIVAFTEDGGLTWTDIGLIEKDIVTKVTLHSLDNLWALGVKTSRSEDSGQNWSTWNWFSPVLEGERRFIPTDIHVFDPDSIWLIGNAFTDATDGSAVLITTYDSGETWWLELDVFEDGYYALEVKSQHVWIVGKEGLIIYRNLKYPTPIEENGNIPFSFELKQNYPNPFNPVTTINYQLPRISDVKLVIYDMLGREVTTLVSEVKPAGSHQVNWDASGYASGIYYYRIEAGDFQQVRKMMLLK